MAKGPFMEFLRAIAIQPAINTYGQTQIPTPTSKTENMAMLIHQIELIPNAVVDAAPVTGDTVMLHLTSASKTTIAEPNDPDNLAYFKAVTLLNAVWHGITYLGSMMSKFDPPILMPKANLYVGIHSAGMAATHEVTAKIGYTLEKVSREDFISALVE